MTVLDIQRRLLALGHDPGPLDGAWGRRSRAALVAFQKSAGLDPDGVAGPRTLAALNDKPTPALADLTADPPWLAEARRFMGLKEIAGPASNPQIVEWGRRAAEWYVDDDIPWCGVFVHAMLASALPDEPLPANPCYARGWAAFGRALPEPAPGAVLVFARGPKAGHVGFYVGEDSGRFRVLGGNQSNAVGEAWVAKSRLLATRWPNSVARPVHGRVAVTAAGATSADEA